MIPILFDENATDFTTNGIGRLSDCITCEVSETRNGPFEVEFTYPITGRFYSEITEGRIILVSHDEQKDLQPFEIYRRSAPISGIVTFFCHHISYRLSNVIVSPFEASSLTEAFEYFSTHAMTENPFTFWTNKTSGGSFSVSVPTSIRAALGGTSGSILDVYGGEFKFDNYLVRLYSNRGANNGVTIRYGKNLADIKNVVDTDGLYNAVIPYWSDGNATVVWGSIVTGEGGLQRVADWTDENGVPIQDENGEHITFKYYKRAVVPMDLSSEFEDAPTVSQLENKARTILNSNTPWIPHVNIDVDFVQLWQTEEYKNIAPLERVQLCDTVNVYYEALGVNATAKVIKVVWNALTERYDKMELGEAQASFADVIMADTEQKITEDVPSWSDMDLAIANATNLITGGMGGHIVFLYDANGKPTDMLVMDTEDTATAVHVLRINVNGIGFSSSGVQGPYTTAWTLNSVFNADFIVAGTMSAARIKGGTLTLGGVNNGNGSIVVYDASGNVIGRWNNAGIEINGGTIRTSDGTRTATIDTGYTKYYSGRYSDSGNYIYIGDIGVRTDFNASDDRGLSFGLAYTGDYMGWFVSQNSGNTNYQPVLIYSKDAYLTKDIWEDSITALCDFHVADGYCLSGTRIEDPEWKFSGTNYAGYTGNVTINNVRMTFKNGVLTNAANT